MSSLWGDNGNSSSSADCLQVRVGPPLEWAAAQEGGEGVGGGMSVEYWTSQLEVLKETLEAILRSPDAPPVVVKGPEPEGQGQPLQVRWVVFYPIHDPDMLQLVYGGVLIATLKAGGAVFMMPPTGDSAVDSHLGRLMSAVSKFYHSSYAHKKQTRRDSASPRGLTDRDSSAASSPRSLSISVTSPRTVTPPSEGGRPGAAPGAHTRRERSTSPNRSAASSVRRAHQRTVTHTARHTDASSTGSSPGSSHRYRAQERAGRRTVSQNSWSNRSSPGLRGQHTLQDVQEKQVLESNGEAEGSLGYNFRSRERWSAGSTREGARPSSGGLSRGLAGQGGSPSSADAEGEGEGEGASPYAEERMQARALGGDARPGSASNLSSASASRPGSSHRRRMAGDSRAQAREQALASSRSSEVQPARASRAESRWGQRQEFGASLSATPSFQRVGSVEGRDGDGTGRRGGAMQGTGDVSSVPNSLPTTAPGSPRKGSSVLRTKALGASSLEASPARSSSAAARAVAAARAAAAAKAAAEAAALAAEEAAAEAEEEAAAEAAAQAEAAAEAAARAKAAAEAEAAVRTGAAARARAMAEAEAAARARAAADAERERAKAAAELELAERERARAEAEEAARLQAAAEAQAAEKAREEAERERQEAEEHRLRAEQAVAEAERLRQEAEKERVRAERARAEAEAAARRQADEVARAKAQEEADAEVAAHIAAEAQARRSKARAEMEIEEEGDSGNGSTAQSPAGRERRSMRRWSRRKASSPDSVTESELAESREVPVPGLSLGAGKEAQAQDQKLPPPPPMALSLSSSQSPSKRSSGFFSSLASPRHRNRALPRLAPGAAEIEEEAGGYTPQPLSSIDPALEWSRGAFGEMWRQWRLGKLEAGSVRCLEVKVGPPPGLVRGIEAIEPPAYWAESLDQLRLRLETVLSEGAEAACTCGGRPSSAGPHRLSRTERIVGTVTLGMLKIRFGAGSRRTRVAPCQRVLCRNSNHKWSTVRRVLLSPCSEEGAVLLVCAGEVIGSFQDGRADYLPPTGDRVLDQHVGKLILAVSQFYFSSYCRA